MRRTLVRVLVGLAVVVGLIVFEVVGTGSRSNALRPAPALPTAVLQPPRVTLGGLRGRPALINFWASWCDPCRQEAPEIERLYRSLHGAAGLVGVDYTDQTDAARSFLHSYGWTFPVLSDPDGVFGARYGFSGLPTTVVLDAGGRIVQTLRGPQTEQDLREALDAARGR